MLTQILVIRISLFTEGIVAEYQNFGPGRSTINQFFTVKQILIECWKFNVDVLDLRELQIGVHMLIKRCFKAMIQNLNQISKIGKNDDDRQQNPGQTAKEIVR